MTALGDVRAAIEEIPVGDRAHASLYVGVSAERAIVAELQIRKDEAAELPETIDGVEVYRSPTFDGWELRK